VVTCSTAAVGCIKHLVRFSDRVDGVVFVEECGFHRVLFMLLERTRGSRRLMLVSVYRNVAMGEEAERGVGEMEELEGRVLSAIEALLALEVRAKRAKRMIGGNNVGDGGRMLHWILFAKLLFAREFIQSVDQLAVDDDNGDDGGVIDVATVEETAVRAARTDATRC